MSVLQTPFILEERGCLKYADSMLTLGIRRSKYTNYRNE